MPENQWYIGKLEYFGMRFDVNVYSKVKIMELYLGETFRNISAEESKNTPNVSNQWKYILAVSQ